MLCKERQRRNLGKTADPKKPWQNVQGEWDDRKKLFNDQFDSGKRRLKKALADEVERGKDALIALIENTGRGGQEANLNPLSIQLSLEYIGREHQVRSVDERPIDFDGEDEVVQTLDTWGVATQQSGGGGSGEAFAVDWDSAA